MKKINAILFLILMTFAFVMADDTVKVLRIYKDGDITTIPLAYIDSIDHSKYDIENVLWNEHKTSILWSVDSTYRLPLEEIDSMVIDHVSMQKLSTNMNLIKEHLSSLDGQPVDQFQNNLLSWLNNECDYVYKATLSPSKEHIIVEMREGMEIYLSFVNTDDLISDIDEDASYARIKSDNKSKQKFYNISSIPGEEIINPKTLYIQGRSMPSKEKELRWSNADEEWKELQEIFSLSPIVNGKDNLKKNSKSLSFLEEDFSKYGLIIISQAHGDDGKSGDFEIEDELHWKWWRKSVVSSDEVDEEKQICVTPVITIYIGQGLCYFSDEPNVYWVRAKSLRSKFKNNPVYASYCFSSYLGNEATNATIYGYRSSVWYNAPGWHKTPAKDSLISRIDKFCNGYIFTDAMWLKPYLIEYYHIPSINKQNTKQRYFSISTKEITETGENGQPIISGKINGYDKLKKDSLTYLIYFREGDEKFSPENAKENECLPLQMPEYHNISDFEIKEDGSFSFEYPGFLKTGTKYEMIFAFEYRNNIYYGETKYIVPEEKDDTITEGDVIDLGLSVKWASCNYGALTPDQLGTKININIISEIYKANPDLFNEDATKGNLCKSVYDMPYKNSFGKLRMPSYEELNELKEKCKWELAVINGTAGARVVGPNNNSIFLPTITSFMETMELGNMYTLNNTSYTSGTYDRNMGWSLMALCISGYYMPQLNLASYLSVVFGNDFDAYIRPVAE